MSESDRPVSSAPLDTADGGQSESRRSNRWIFEVVEFDEWSNRQSENPALNVEEAYLVTRFFNKDSSTVDAGTGGGRVALALRDAGYTDLHAFDFVPGNISRARDRDPDGSIEFDVMDATDLQYADHTFGQVIYPLAMISAIESEGQRQKAIREAWRVLKPGGVAIMTALPFEGARRSTVHAALIRYLTVLRTLRRSSRSLHDLPWLRLRQKTNWSALADRGPYLHWYTISEFQQDLLAGGFSIEALATKWQIERDHLCGSIDELVTEPVVGMFYAVCRKSR